MWGKGSKGKTKKASVSWNLERINDLLHIFVFFRRGDDLKTGMLDLKTFSSNTVNQTNT